MGAATLSNTAPEPRSITGRVLHLRSAPHPHDNFKHLDYDAKPVDFILIDQAVAD